MKPELPILKDEVSFQHDEWSKYYGNNFYCPNCGERTHKYVLKGKLLKTIRFDCPNCGCEVRG